MLHGGQLCCGCLPLYTSLGNTECVGYARVHTGYYAGGEHFLGICVQNRTCANHTLPARGVWGHAPPEKFSCPEIASGGFWQLADYPTFVFKMTTV